DDKEYKIEVFVWESLDNPIPLTEKAIINIKDMVIGSGIEIDNAKRVDTFTELKYYVLSLINKDRLDHGLEPVKY
ncbi:MAG: hypothetical protein D6752_00495, partial [Candidatus Nitrosothermus koennekii]